ncbi:hypothetical protein VB780_12505 [Leptolyngbya sp. CCNP1308]|uniref:DUF7219 family protein n=1 Tax=Leptolyngbya sp. CCNP1308 TaxID=3110255 RepID=UPI002B211FAF|nr:hypothetical protein [Leptolyngbya sp. CCNP1308]MEA5449396.1 hypothetical protein [Leptolyngbya sp. CCNP1308]
MSYSGSSNNRRDLDGFISPKSSYYGTFSPQQLVFNANLQEFANRVGYISGLQTGGKLSPDEAFEQIKSLYKQLKQTKKGLEI